MPFNGAPSAFKAGSFWNNIRNNWTSRKPTTRLSVEQKASLEAGCPWISSTLTALQQRREIASHRAVQQLDL